MRSGGKVPVRLGHELEGTATHDGDGGVGEGGEIAWEVAGPRPAAIFVVGEVAHVVEPVLDLPVLASEGEQLLGFGLLAAQ